MAEFAKKRRKKNIAAEKRWDCLKKEGSYGAIGVSVRDSKSSAVQVKRI